MHAMTDVTPWYRQLWPWMLISIPALSVLGGVVMLWLAFNGGDSLVVDDYYKQGKAINQQLARDEKAAQLELVATIRPDPAGLRLRIDGKGFIAPSVVQGRAVHIARKELDEPLEFARMPNGDYLSSGSLPKQGWWRFHLEDPAGLWRLVSAKWQAGGTDEVALSWRDEHGAGGVGP